MKKCSVRLQHDAVKSGKKMDRHETLFQLSKTQESSFSMILVSLESSRSQPSNDIKISTTECV